MCGLFGFFGSRPEPGLLALAASHSARRGPDAWGVLDASGMRRGLQRLDGSALRATGPLVMGHCRLATVLGTARDLRAVQPFQRAGMAVSHNGAVYNHRALGLPLRTPSDSEAWLELMLADDGPLAGRFARAADRADHHGYYAVAVHFDGELVLSARRMPLFVHERPEGVYWSSVSPSRDPNRDRGWRRIEDASFLAR